MNIIFFSPHFPKYCQEFCYQLRELGVRVLGIGDVDYELLSDKLKGSLTEYRKVDRLENYDEVLRAVAYYTYRYGKIDRFESLNEHWLELEAQIRTDFHIPGTKLDFIANLKRKSRMKRYFAKSGVPSIRTLTKLGRLSNVKKFALEVEYPLVMKPDQGSGASMTYRIDRESELLQAMAARPAGVDFILQEYIDGVIETFDGLVDRDGNVVFAASHLFPHSIMEAVNTGSHFTYYCLRKVRPDIEQAGRSILRAYGVKERFFHLEFFRLRSSGSILALEVNMRPPGTWMTDAINYSYEFDIYRQWANMIVNNRAEGPTEGAYYTGFASRKLHIPYRIGHDEIIERYGSQLVRHEPIADSVSQTRGHYAYQFRSERFEEVQAIADAIHAVTTREEVAQ